MCGITAYLGEKNASLVILEGLTILQNRGYDSAGISTINNKNQIITTKSASQETTCDSIKYLSNSLHFHEDNNIGIGHTRWATHGPKTDINAHPHNDCTQRFSVVHNGVIENHNIIRNFLSEHRINCISGTDTEVIVQLIYYYSSTGLGFEDSVKSTVSKLEGTWGIVIIDSQTPNTIIVARHGSPILLGIGQDEIFVGSEVSAFQKHTRQYISLNNNEIAILKYNNEANKGNKIEMILSENGVNNRIKVAETEEILTTPDPYPHWTIKEINEQPNAITFALNNGGRIIDNGEVVLGGLNRNKESLLKIKNIIIIGCGTSRHAGLFISGIMRSLCGFSSVQVVDASEFDMSYINDTKNVGILALSQSGETKDVMRCLEMVSSRDDIPIFSVVNSVGSQIARTTNCGVYLNAGREVAVASTKAFTSQIVVLSLISIWYGQNRGIHAKKRTDLTEDLKRLSILYKQVLSSTTIDNSCNTAAEYLKSHNTCFILGKGLASTIAYEGALKIKEIGYLHAEGYPGGALKHGPFALIENGTPIILILLKDSDCSYMESTISEVKSRKAYTIIITDISDFNEGDINIHIPSNGTLTSLIAVVPLQLIAYKLSISKGINPDKPRNLAKTVTVI
jgi:glucosamine--fructose-6-phosphate aminotransferase (isomerizing)